MPLRDSRNTPEDELAMRVGGTAAGLLAGLVVGVILAAVLIIAKAESASGWACLVSTVSGAVIGYVSASTGLSFAEAVVHFLIGTFGGLAQQEIAPSPLASCWLRWILFVGIACGLLLGAIHRW